MEICQTVVTRHEIFPSLYTFLGQASTDGAGNARGDCCEVPSSAISVLLHSPNLFSKFESHDSYKIILTKKYVNEK